MRGWIFLWVIIKKIIVIKSEVKVVILNIFIVYLDLVIKLVIVLIIFLVVFLIIIFK